MIHIALIRHGETPSNRRGRWVGRTDDPITPEAKKKLEELWKFYGYPKADVIYRSPLLRCLQTMQIIYPGREATILEDLAELDFGEYEGAYARQAIQTLGENPILEKRRDFRFTGGESFEMCLSRGIRALDTIIHHSLKEKDLHISVITHSMWIGTFLHYCLEGPIAHGPLYCGNGMGIVICVDPEKWRQKRIVHFEKYVPVGAPRPKIEDSPYYK